jgi:hypothetical protein
LNWEFVLVALPGGGHQCIPLLGFGLNDLDFGLLSLLVLLLVCFGFVVLV